MITTINRLPFKEIQETNTAQYIQDLSLRIYTGDERNKLYLQFRQATNLIFFFYGVMIFFVHLVIVNKVATS